jgi:glucose-1-phosphate cytidylyltransferase
MKTVILAGGLGTRLMEETGSTPKPMVTIGGKPMLWHIMKMYEFHGFTEFIICLGYKGEQIKEYFCNYFMHNSDLTIELADNKIKIHSTQTESFKVTLVDTGLTTNTAGRIKRIQKYVGGERFMLTYGDGVSNVDINQLIDFHEKSNKLATLTSIQLPGRYGNIKIDDHNTVLNFQEKPEGDGVWINGGFFVLEPGIFDYLKDDNIDEVQWEQGPLIKITDDRQLSTYRHPGFWKSMDALRDKIELEELWKAEKALWKKWN